MCGHRYHDGRGYVCEFYDNKVLERGNKLSSKTFGPRSNGNGETPTEFWHNINNVDSNRIDEQEKIYRLIDSRVDKVVDNVSREIAYLNQMVDKLQNDKTVING